MSSKKSGLNQKKHHSHLDDLIEKAKESIHKPSKFRVPIIILLLTFAALTATSSIIIADSQNKAVANQNQEKLSSIPIAAPTTLPNNTYNSPQFGFSLVHPPCFDAKTIEDPEYDEAAEFFPKSQPENSLAMLYALKGNQLTEQLNKHTLIIQTDLKGKITEQSKVQIGDFNGERIYYSTPSASAVQQGIAVISNREFTIILKSTSTAIPGLLNALRF